MKWIKAKEQLPTSALLPEKVLIRWKAGYNNNIQFADYGTLDELKREMKNNGYEYEWLNEIEEFEPCEVTLKMWFEKGSIVCCEGGCKEIATKDYNGHGHFVCSDHYDKLNDYFDENYS